MRALGSLLLVLAQLRPVLGIILCVTTAPVAPVGEAGCTEGDHGAMPAQAPMDHGLRWDAAGAPSGPACGLAVHCSPAGQGPVATSIPMAAGPAAEPAPVTRLVTAPCTDLTAPPTPPPNA